MKHKLKITIIIMIVSLLSVVPAFARLSFAGGVSTDGGSLRAWARVAGVGGDGGSVIVTLKLESTDAPLIAMCQNKGGNQAPGQNPVEVSLLQQEYLTVDSNGSGVAYFHVDYLPSARDAGCPNRNWIVTDLLGYLQVTMTEVNTLDGEMVQTVLSCYVEDTNSVVECTEVSTTYTPGVG
jgi:hypothetical protein